MAATTMYRGFRIYYDPKPYVLSTSMDWTFVHDDYEEGDLRYGYAEDPDDAKRMIDILIAELEEKG